MTFHKVGFIGLGLIGGSIAKKLKQNDPAVEIIASAHHEDTVAEAFREGLISNRTIPPLHAFADCDCIILCAPVQRNIDCLKDLKDIISPGCLLTDVGSTKTAIHEEIIRLGLEDSFIGGHPMTGSEKTGIRNADALLLENAYYIITPTKATEPARLTAFRDFVASLGSIPLIMDYETHDYSAAAISHLPHMIAFSLVNLVQDIDDKKETMKTIAAGGFKDLTRIASSSPQMWQSICTSNQKHILALMDRYIDSMQELRDSIASGAPALSDYFARAKEYRDSITVKSVNSPDRFYELFADLADEAGGIAAIAAILAAEGISIRNIGIVHNREFALGVLRIEFYSEEALTLAVKLLEQKGYRLHHR